MVNGEFFNFLILIILSFFLSWFGLVCKHQVVTLSSSKIWHCYGDSSVIIQQEAKEELSLAL